MQQLQEDEKVQNNWAKCEKDVENQLLSSINNFDLTIPVINLTSAKIQIIQKNHIITSTRETHDLLYPEHTLGHYF